MTDNQGNPAPTTCALNVAQPGADNSPDDRPQGVFNIDACLDQFENCQQCFGDCGNCGDCTNCTDCGSCMKCGNCGSCMTCGCLPCGFLSSFRETKIGKYLHIAWSLSNWCVVVPIHYIVMTFFSIAIDFGQYPKYIKSFSTPDNEEANRGLRQLICSAMNIVAMIVTGVLIVYELNWNYSAKMSALQFLVATLIFSVFALAIPSSRDNLAFWQVQLFNVMNLAQAICSTIFFYYIIEDAKNNVDLFHALKYFLWLCAMLFNVSRFQETAAMQHINKFGYLIRARENLSYCAISSAFLFVGLAYSGDSVLLYQVEVMILAFCMQMQWVFDGINVIYLLNWPKILGTLAAVDLMAGYWFLKDHLMLDEYSIVEPAFILFKFSWLTYRYYISFLPLVGDEKDPSPGNNDLQDDPRLDLPEYEKKLGVEKLPLLLYPLVLVFAPVVALLFYLVKMVSYSLQLLKVLCIEVFSLVLAQIQFPSFSLGTFSIPFYFHTRKEKWEENFLGNLDSWNQMIFVIVHILCLIDLVWLPFNSTAIICIGFFVLHCNSYLIFGFKGKLYIRNDQGRLENTEPMFCLCSMQWRACAEFFLGVTCYLKVFYLPDHADIDGFLSTGITFLAFILYTLPPLQLDIPSSDVVKNFFYQLWCWQSADSVVLSFLLVLLETEGGASRGVIILGQVLTGVAIFFQTLASWVMVDFRSKIENRFGAGGLANCLALWCLICCLLPTYICLASTLSSHVGHLPYVYLVKFIYLVKAGYLGLKLCRWNNN